MKFNYGIIKYLSERCGCDVTTASGATVLALDIQLKTGERLAANTIKRLVGVLPYNFTPRNSTLKILAKYLGYPSWENFMESISDRILDFDKETMSMNFSELDAGAVVILKCQPDREIHLYHLGEGYCEVVKVSNSNLEVGDILKLT